MPVDQQSETEASAARSAALKEARVKRADLHAVIIAVEEAIAAPAAGREVDWSHHVHDALVELGAAYERHIAVVEGPGGLFEEITAAAPRLTNTLQRLEHEHRTIRDSVAAAVDTVRLRAGADVRQVAERGREAVIAVLDELMRHRQLGADLVYDAYAVDIGTGD